MIEQNAPITVEEAQARILEAITPLDAVSLPLDRVLGLVLARDVAANHDNPSFNNAAMDGYACRADEIAEATQSRPIWLPVTAEIVAGAGDAGLLSPGTVVRIMTGAPVPAGADTVVPFEETDSAPGSVGIRVPRAAGSNVRRRGEDFRSGETLLHAGTRLGPSQIALLAALGKAGAAVVRQPRIGILATGNEIVPPGLPLASGQIWDSNGPALAALVSQSGAIPVPLGIVRDDVDELRDRFDEARSAGLDLFITSGGVSAGDFDVVREVLRASGEIAFWSVRIKPGKPLAFGVLDGLPLIGLPGNPVAGIVAFLQFVRPALMKMMGRADVQLPEIDVTLLDRIENRGGRRNFVRVRVDPSPDGWTARSTGAQGSAQLSTLARANGLLVIPEDVALAEPGMRFRVQMPDWDLG